MTMRTLERLSLVTAEPNMDGPSTDHLSLARMALLQSNIYVLRKLHVERDGESLILRGRVDSYYHKQLAQELVRTVVERIEVVNALHVVYTPKTDYLLETR